MFQEQCDPQVEGKACSYKVFRQWMRRRDDPSCRITQKVGKREEESLYFQKELVNLSRSAGRTSAGTSVELKTFVIHYL